MSTLSLPPGCHDMLDFGLVDALLGRRSRRFFRVAGILDGVLAYDSGYGPLALTELERLLVVGACGANTSWHHMIYRAARYAPHLSNYARAAGGRTFPSAAGFYTGVSFSRTTTASGCWTCVTPRLRPTVMRTGASTLRARSDVFGSACAA